MSFLVDSPDILGKFLLLGRTRLEKLPDIFRSLGVLAYFWKQNT